MKLEWIMLLLPIVFMLHEYEEVIMFEHWLRSNRNELKQRFPKVERYISHKGYFNFSTSTFAVGTAHEFVLIALITVCAVWLDAYPWWWAALVGHTVHLLVHLAQYLVYRKYIPVITTTILTLPYCAYALMLWVKAAVLTPSQMVLWGLLGIVLTGLSLCSAFFLMSRFQRWQDRH